MSIKQDQYTVIEYTRREAAAIKTRARKMVNEKCKNTRLSAAVSSACWLPLTPKSSHVTLGPGVCLNLRFSGVASVLGFLLLPPATQICGKRMFGVT